MTKCTITKKYIEKVLADIKKNSMPIPTDISIIKEDIKEIPAYGQLTLIVSAINKKIYMDEIIDSIIFFLMDNIKSDSQIVFAFERFIYSFIKNINKVIEIERTDVTTMCF